LSKAEPRDRPGKPWWAAEGSGAATPATVPRSSSLFAPVRDRYGWRLALVFGNHAPGGVCPYYAGARCRHCDIGAGEGAAFDHQTNRRRLQWFREHYAKLWPELSHLVLYNSGSILNPLEMPRDLLEEILTFADSLPALRAISLESRESFIKPDSLTRTASMLGPGRAVRPILGVETANDRFRNGLLNKQMPHQAVVLAFQAVGEVSRSLGRGRVGLDVNVVVGVPGTTPQTAVEDALQTARFAFEKGVEYDVAVDLNLHPYYPSGRGLASFPGQGRCPLSVLARATVMICEVGRSLAPGSAVFIGWQDEGHDRDPYGRALELADAQAAFDTFNRTQDPICLLALASSLA